MLTKMNNISNSRLLRKVAINAEAVAQKFIKEWITNNRNFDFYTDQTIEKKTQPIWGINSREKIYSDQYIGTITAIKGTTGGSCIIQLFDIKKFDSFIKNNIKSDLSFKDKFKSLFSDKAKKKIRDEVLRAVLRILENNVEKILAPYDYKLAHVGMTKGMNKNIQRDEEMPWNDEVNSKFCKVLRLNWRKHNFDNGIIEIIARVPVFKIDINSNLELTQDQINKFYSPEFQKVLKTWMPDDPAYYSQLKNYITTNVKEISKKMQYEKMSGNQ